ncbi:hypothetical protein M0R88_16210 [Halorussus gelatinilyticus]|uniref:Matrixin n=1 Tax=Halorussus gelatinilyticus TaxID=2937524 RepID=A0A8U0IID8_9EURY|nr:hypothetical protein [Halorussus gelatinilyticus]UPW00044.1 hypothetical protein M0R88_16210 [Halorussus gelatinilyticus]
MLDLRTVALVALVLLAGCSGGLGGTTTPDATTSTAPTETTTTPNATASLTETTATTTTTEATTAPATSTTASTETPTTASTGMPTATDERTDVENPWGRRNVTVAVRNTANRSRNVAPLVERTLAYWNGEGSEYAHYDVTFVPTSEVIEADVVVEFVKRIESCNGTDTNSTVGCAPLLDGRAVPSDPARVQVVAGYSNQSTVEILKHEFGHVVGVEHGEEPMPTMQAMSAVTHLSQPDLRDRAVPWHNSTLAVHVDVSALPGHEREAAREQIRHALDYYESGADGTVPSNVSFVRTSNRSAADVRIQIPDEAFDCGGERLREGSCGESWVYDTDTDDAPEYFASYDVRVRGIDTDAIGWHVGYWLSDAMGLTEAELPSPFVDADYDERRSEWWT